MHESCLSILRSTPHQCLPVSDYKYLIWLCSLLLLNMNIILIRLRKMIKKINPITLIMIYPSRDRTWYKKNSFSGLYRYQRLLFYKITKKDRFAIKYKRPVRLRTSFHFYYNIYYFHLLMINRQASSLFYIFIY